MTPVDTSFRADAGDGGASCQYGPPADFESRRACAAPSDCTTVSIPKDCCGDVVYGVRQEHLRAVTGQVVGRTAACPACGCAVQPMDEFGVRGTSFTAACAGGKCVAHAE